MTQNTSELLRRVRRIELVAKRKSEESLQGNYQSAFKGRGMTFSEVREYQWGDDIRNIDWNVTARWDHPYIKVYQEEREQTLFFIIDSSISTQFGTQNLHSGMGMRSDLLAELVASLSLSALRNHDLVGALYHSNATEKIIAPGRGNHHVLNIVQQLIEMPLQRLSDANEALQRAARLLKRKSIICWVSDFNFAANYGDALRALSYKHQVLGVHLYDVREYELPRMGLLPVQDMETQQTHLLDSEDEATRRWYKERWFARQAAHSELFQQAGASFLSLDSRVDWLPPIQEWMKKY